MAISSLRNVARSVGLLVALFGAIGDVRAESQLDPRVADEVLYHFMPIAWRDSDNDPQRYGDFNGMIASLDYLETLGVTGVWMNPIFPSPAYHGYQHGPADQINARFGSEAEFLAFVAAAKQRGIDVYLDLVVYGISQSTTWYQSAFGNPQSPYDSWLAFTNSSNTQYLGSRYTTWNGATVGFIHWDLRNAAPRDLVIAWSQHWLDPDGDGDPIDGIAGYRLDHVWKNYNSGPSGWGYNLDSFWVPWKQGLLDVNPDVFTFAEQADWGSWGTELLPAHDGTFTIPMMFTIRDALNSGQASGLYGTIEGALRGTPAGKTRLAVIGTHDVDRLASVLGSNPGRDRVAAAILMTQPFPPVIYYGDEIGMRGVKNTSYRGDAADIPMREPFKWNAVAGPPMTNYDNLYSPAYNNRVSQNNDGRSVEEQLGQPGSLLEEYRALIALRHENIALRRGGFENVPNGNTGVFAFVREHSAQDVLVVMNLRGSVVNTTLDLSELILPDGGTTPVDLRTGGSWPTITTANQAAYPVTLPGYGVELVELSVSLPPPPETLADGLAIPDDAAPLAALATQDTPTSAGDNLLELNQVFVRREGAALRIGVTGNLAVQDAGLALLVDSRIGGQATLSVPATAGPSVAPLLSGLRVDDGFLPDELLLLTVSGGVLRVDQYALPAGQIARLTYRGSSPVSSNQGFLSGGYNPNGMQVALDNGNTAGVTDASASAAATATRGFELYLPLADLGLATSGPQTIQLAALLVEPDGIVTNQTLPGVGGSLTPLGVAPDLRSAPGSQFARVTLGCPGDLDQTGTVGLGDLAVLFSCWGGACGDLTGDGTTDVGDLGLLLSLWSLDCDG